MSPTPAAVEPESVLAARPFSLRQRIFLWLISWASYLAISVIGPTLRYSISWEEPPSPPNAIFEKPVIYSFWHRAVFPSAWLWRKTGIAVMVSRSFDGEYIARTLEKLGFIAVRGSSSRDGAKALLGLRSQLQRGNSVVFTIDGPRGPRFVAKPGPVLLSSASNTPMAAFCVALSDAWVLNTWDALMIPKPFSKALVRLSAKMQVPAETRTETFLERDAHLAEFHGELQSALERVTAYAEEHVAQVGTSEFPLNTR
ncbi:MAG: lysophospholipid acyltransferase family protein [Terriglobales bacterium]